MGSECSEEQAFRVWGLGLQGFPDKNVGLHVSGLVWGFRVGSVEKHLPNVCE